MNKEGKQYSFVCDWAREAGAWASREKRLFYCVFLFVSCDIQEAQMYEPLKNILVKCSYAESNTCSFKKNKKLVA